MSQKEMRDVMAQVKCVAVLGLWMFSGKPFSELSYVKDFVVVVL